MNGKDKEGSDLITGSIVAFCTEGPRKTTTNLRQDTRSPARDLNWNLSNKEPNAIQSNVPYGF
jgi:hypothetical protein